MRNKLNYFIFVDYLNKNTVKTRLFLSLFMLLGLTISSYAQQTYVPINFNALQKKLKKSNEEIQHPKKNLAAKTWIKRGELMHDIFRIDIDQIYDGMDLVSLKLFYKEPKDTATIEVDGENTTVYEYDRIKYYFQNERLLWWEKTETILEDPLGEAYKSFIKALDIDKEGKYTSKIKEDLVTLKSLYKQFGLNEYYAGSKKSSLDNFIMVGEINKMDLFQGEIDTLMVQYSGIIAREIGDFETAAKQYWKLAEMGQGGPNTYLLLKEDYLALKDTLNAINAMEQGFSVYPDSINLVANLIDLYIKTQNIDKGLQKIDESIKLNPEKGEFYYWKGRLLLNSSEEDMVDKVLEVYEKAIKYNPTLYYVYYDIGLIYFLQGQDLFNQGGMERDVKRRELYTEVATEKYQNAVPMLEKSLEYNEINVEIKKETLDTLRRIYYRLQMNEKYEEVNKMLNDLRNN